MSNLITSFLLTRDRSGAVTFGLTPSMTVAQTTLAPNVAQSVIVPAGAILVLYEFSADTWVNSYGVATIPGGAFTFGTSEMNPNLRSVSPGSTISFISDTACRVSVAFYENYPVISV
jgi:hypothetical protein